jgi:Tol biopolymer transport system component
LYERRDVPKLMIYDLNTKQKTTEDLGTEYHRVYSMDFINPGQMVFSATVRGFSDIFIYYLKTRQSERVTNDFYDDLDASFVNIGGYKGILFTSNRQDSLISQMRLDSILPINTFDVYFYNLNTKSNELVRVTNTPLANERLPMAADSTYFAFITDQSGNYNR